MNQEISYSEDDESIIHEIKTYVGLLAYSLFFICSIINSINFILFYQATIPDRLEMYYHCQMFKLPQEVIETNHNLLRVSFVFLALKEIANVYILFCLIH